jgi:hypothetical protein
LQGEVEKEGPELKEGGSTLGKVAASSKMGSSFFSCGGSDVITSEFLTVKGKGEGK